MTDNKKIGVYVCHCGGNISDVVDVERVVEAAGKLECVAVARREMFMCSDPGQKRIADDIAEKGLEAVVVAACSPSLHEQTFRDTLARAGLNPYLYEHANIREQVSWCHKNDPEGATSKAARLVAAAVAKARKLEALEPVRISARRAVAAIGGGVAGMRCAIELARGGFEVHLVERDRELGGHLARAGRVYPTDERARDIIDGLLQQVREQSSLTVHADSEVIASTGSLGNFRLTVRGPDSATQEILVGAIVLATGFADYRPGAGEFGFGASNRVITLPDLIERLDADGPTSGRLVPDGPPVRSVAFIHCVGSRQLEGVHTPPPGGKPNEFCSRVCCTAALRAATEVRDRFPDVDVFELYQDIRAYGRGHEDLHEAAARAGVTFLRYAGDAPPQVIVDENGTLGVQVTDTLTFGESLIVPADLVVLVTGLIPRDITPLVQMFKLPRTSDGFLQEVHPKLRPVELNVDGVFIAGTCQAPMDIGETSVAAAAAAAKAACLLGSGEILLPPFVAAIDTELCDGCGICVTECAHVNAITLPAGAKVPVINTAVCKGCGMCVAACPPRALFVHGWRFDQFEAMVDAIVAAEALHA